MIELAKGDLKLTLSHAGEYYKGTRFDRAGVFRRLSKGDCVYADEWFDNQDPFAHDHVCGPSEEFVTVDFDGVAPGGTFVKPGVGLLRRPDDQPYDWFHLYDVVDEGLRSEIVSGDCAEYYQYLEGYFDYVKKIRLLSDSSFEIFHKLGWKADKPLRGYTYNHNFFTFDGAPVGPSREIDFPFSPTGHWRAEYSSVALSERGIRFFDLPELPSVYMGDIHSTDGRTPYQLSVSDGERRVDIRGSHDLDHIVFWSNRRVACLEPYLPLSLRRGDSFSWSIIYTLK